MRSIALLGDSVFDNGAYTGGEPDVAGWLRRLAPDARVTLCAVDGATTADVAPQLAAVPADATELVLSAGGNDALANADLLGLPCRSTAEALDLFGERIAAFRQGYARMLDAVLALGRRTTVCTVYEAELDEAVAARARVALTMFDDVILREAFARRLAVIDLRLVCTEPNDYVQQIEPSATGGLKIARAILDAVGLPCGPAASVVCGG